MKQESIENAVKILTDDMRRSSQLMVHDTTRLATDAEVLAHSRAVSAICDEMDELARRTASEDIRYAEFQILLDKLKSHYVPLTLQHETRIARAFYQAGLLAPKPARADPSCTIVSQGGALKIDHLRCGAKIAR